MSWQGSTRRSRLPADWNQRRATVLQRDPQCRLAYPNVCTVRSTEVDHIKAGDDHRLTNLQGVCHPCHKVKTNAERPTERRTPQPHPGLR